jgi:hypothetical protein
MNIEGTTLILICWYPLVFAGPEKPQTLTASKTKYILLKKVTVAFTKLKQ